jgi:hypothetical protein
LARTARAIEDALARWASLWDLLELEPRNGGYGRKADCGKVLLSLDPKTLREVDNRLDGYETGALKRDKHGRYTELRYVVRTCAWLGALAPNNPLVPEQGDETLPLHLAGYCKTSGLWAEERVENGLSSGEGLIYQVKSCLTCRCR